MFANVEPIDWNDLTAAARVTQDLLRRVAADRQLLTDLVHSAADDPELFSKCEHDIVEDKIVLWEDMSKGFRLRLRMATMRQEELAHQHRFSFTTLVLHGSYLHRTYALQRPFVDGVGADDFETVSVHEDGPGTLFTIAHDTIHSTPLARADTIALVMRGPAVKDAAPVIFREERTGHAPLRTTAAPGTFEPAEAQRGDFFWRFGETSEAQERRDERQMSPALFRSWCDRLAELGLIDPRPLSVAR